jgi:hypothetical protein
VPLGGLQLGVIADAPPQAVTAGRLDLEPISLAVQAPAVCT